MGRLGLLVIVLASAACIHASSEVCSDGTLCAADTTCDVVHHRCLSAEQTDACDGKLEGEDCTVGDQPGACREHACEAFFCGDGIITGNELCDGALPPDIDCKALGFYAGPGLVCDSSCRLDSRACGGGYCGDHTVNGPEVCDGMTDLTCFDIGYDAGSVSCANCGLTVQDCTRFGWNAEPLGSMIAQGVHGIASNDLWAVGTEGKTAHYDGFWHQIGTGVPNALVGVWQVAHDDVWAVGLETNALPNIVLHHTAAGWAPVTTVPVAAYVDVWAANANAVFIASKDKGIFEWNGTSWTTIGIVPGTPIEIRGVTESDLWVATAEGPLQHWNGTTWVAAPLPDARIHFIDANSATDVWVAGSDNSLNFGVIAHWNGSAWTVWRNLHETYNNIASSGPKDAWVMRADDTLTHWDGVGWARTATIGSSPSGLTAMAGMVSLSADEVVGVSTLNLAYRYRGQAFGVFPELSGFALPDPRQNTSISSRGIDDVYVTNALGEVRHYDGTSWSVVFATSSPPSTEQASAVWASGPNDVYVASSLGNLYHFADARWATVDHGGTTAPLDRVWGSGPTDVWVAGTGGGHHFDGTSWTYHPIAPMSVTGLSGTGPTDAWAVSGGALWHWDGTAWTAEDPHATQRMLNVVALSPTEVIATAERGRIERLSNGAWREIVVPALDELDFLAASSREDVIAASRRELFHFDGTQWSPMRPPIDFEPNTPNFIPITGLAVAPNRVDILLASQLVRTLIRTKPVLCQQTDDCTNGVDDDCNGIIDDCAHP